jgi:hypothetical protein
VMPQLIKLSCAETNGVNNFSFAFHLFNAHPIN